MQGAVAHRLKIKNFTFNRAGPNSFPAIVKWSRLACYWQVEVNQPTRSSLLATEFPKRITTLRQCNFYGSPPPFTFLLTVTYSLGTNFFLSPAFCCCRNKKQKFLSCYIILIELISDTIARISCEKFQEKKILNSTSYWLISMIYNLDEAK